MPLMFDARAIPPDQGGDKHPIGKFAAQITNSALVPVKDKPNFGMLRLQYTTPAGTIDDNFQLWNESSKAVEIAQKQLSAVCHATGIFQLVDGMQGSELRGARLMIEVGWQKGQEPTAENPAGGYVEVKKVYDAQGNLPGKPPTQNQPQTQPMTQQPGGGWGQPQSTTAAAPAANSGWGGGTTAPAVPANPAPAQGWQPGQGGQGGPANTNPPWGKQG